MRFAVIVLVLVAIGGPVVAMIWWRIAARMAPYEDEERRAGRRKRPHEEARIVRDFD